MRSARILVEAPGRGPPPGGSPGKKPRLDPLFDLQAPRASRFNIGWEQETVDETEQIRRGARQQPLKSSHYLRRQRENPLGLAPPGCRNDLPGGTLSIHRDEG